MAKSIKTKAKRALGRGLSELMANAALSEEFSSPDPNKADSKKQISIELIRPNKNQPRKVFSKKPLEELAASIASKGILQPILVRPDPKVPDLYEIVAGERRWRAAQLAQVHEVPVVIGEFTDLEVLEVAIIENIQRSDLNPVEEALGFKQLQEKFSQSQEQLSQALGKSRSYITNALRLLTLPSLVLDWVQEGSLSVGHARAIITTENPSSIARRIVNQGLSVRETEAMVRGVSKKKSVRLDLKKTNNNRKLADTIELEKQLSLNTGHKVTINHKALSGVGVVNISYDSLLELDKICEILS
ncbi:MAG: ParB/RepB/Spo0J family partition protein [Planktomarina sp.]|jgi:ParB family chromosome partitioning protein|nr:ParB/RepB/Spo0J family partition protein [Paracoccaceae bacterium]MBL6846554.1 ParB/RepB/Spo0J family partition protein [Planktomarina sp.]MDG1298994.1 ParB/RepB/Spo0J family partition protein [Paracoccaceae bacterium]|tara:strand:+ start:11272 stop:12177 length:906 start_codon:yes stop_codon:yes gene_type:complete